jgi:hypothetical protein
MNGTQKGILAIGALILLATAAFAPYRWKGYNEERQIFTNVTEDLSGTVYAPMWSVPSPSYGPGDSRAKVTSVRLDSGKVGLWWAGIALLTAVAVLLAGKTKPSAVS